MRSLRDLQNAVVTGLRTGDYGLLDKVLEEGSGSGPPDSVGPFDPFGVFTRELEIATRKERDQHMDAETNSPVLGELRGSESNNPVAGEEQRSGVQRDVQTEVQGSGSDI